MNNKVTVFNDESIHPDNDLVFSVIGDKQLVWKQVMSYLYDNNSDISEVWKYYNDGKSWLFRTLKKKKTIFWINILEDTFRIAFWFADRLEPIILSSKLPGHILEEYGKARHYNRSRCIFIDVEDHGDLENIKILLDLKLSTL